MSSTDALISRDGPLDLLQEFGFTRQESALYVELLRSGPLNGYEAAKALGISRSNAYTALAALVDKGAAWVAEASSVRYSAVPAAEFLDNRLHRLDATRRRLIESLPERRQEVGGYLTIVGAEAIFDRLRHLIQDSEERVYLALEGAILERYETELRECLAAGKKLVIITSREVVASGSLASSLPGTALHGADVEAGQIRAIADTRYVLTGTVGGYRPSCLFSDEPNLVELFRNALRNEIRLAELEARP